MATSEHNLVEAARAGSVAAFTELVRRYQGGLLRYLVTRCQSFADAEDALQDSLVAAFRYLDSYDARWRFSTWLYRIAIRNAQRIRSENVIEFDDIEDSRSDPLRLCMAVSESQNLWLVARRTLNDDVFAALWLRYVEDMSVRDVARAVDRSESWTKVNLMRARRVLDAALSDDSRMSNAYG